LLDAVVEVLGHALGVSRALVIDLDEAGRPEPVHHEFCAVSTGSAREANLDSLRVSEVLENEDGKAIALQDSNQRSLIAQATVDDLRIKSEIAVPVRLDGSVRRMIYLHQCDRTREWQPDEIEFVERVARQLSLSLMSVRSLESARSESQAAKDAARHAAEAQTRIQSLINALPESVLVLDGEGRLNYFNAKGRERFGFTNEDIGRAAGIGERLRSSNGSVWEQVLTSSQPARFGAELTCAARPSTASMEMATAPQTSTPVSISVTPFRATHGGPVVGRIVVVSDVSHVTGTAGVSERIVDLQQKITELESTVDQVRTALRSAEAAEAAARKEVEGAQLVQAEAVAERDKAQSEVARYHAAAQQLLETNRLKSDFIVSAGHEIEASLQPVLGMLELLGQGQYGPLIPEQQEAIRNIYGWARRIKGDVDWLIEYGSARSRRLESAQQQ
jgi:PAS domain-containing protein